LWIAYARTVISQALVRPAELGVAVDPGVAELFEHYLDTWDRLAAASSTFEWTADIPADQVQVMGATWLQIASGLADSAERRGYPISPPEGDEFYRALIGGLLDGLTAEGGDLASLADQLRREWPGLKPDDS
jgi:hypothetical protein